jgi:hypothetical protein
MQRIDIDPTEALLAAASGRRPKDPNVLYSEQARAVRGAGREMVGAMLRQQAKADGLSRQQLAQVLGYRDVSKGCRRIDQLFDGKPIRGDLLIRLVALLDVNEEVTRLREMAHREATALMAKADVERGLQIGTSHIAEDPYIPAQLTGFSDGFSSRVALGALARTAVFKVEGADRWCLMWGQPLCL